MKTSTLILCFMGLIAYSAVGWGAGYDVGRETLKLAKLSKQSYGNGDDVVGYRQIAIKTERSGFAARAYHNATKNEFVIAFAGTDISSLRDWLTNIDSQFGTNPPRQHVEAEKFVDEVIQAIPEGSEVVLVGHSLGGNLAQFVGAKKLIDGTLEPDNLKVITFNPDDISWGLGRGFVQMMNESGVIDSDSIFTNICIEDDPVCNPNDNLGETIFLTPSSRSQGVHSIASVINIIEAFINTDTRENALANNLPDTSALQNMLTAGTNAGNSCIVAASPFTGQPPLPTVNNNEQRVYDNNANTGNNAREMVFTDGVILTPEVVDGEILAGFVRISADYGGNREDFSLHFTGQGDTNPFVYSIPLPRGDRKVTTIIRETSGGNRFHIYETPVIEGGSAPTSSDGITIDDADAFGDEGIYQIYVHDFGNRDQQGSTGLANSGTTVAITQNDNEIARYSVPSDGRDNTWQAIEFDTRTNTIGPTGNFRDINDPDRVPFNDPAVNGLVVDRDTFNSNNEPIEGSDGL